MPYLGGAPQSILKRPRLSCQLLEHDRLVPARPPHTGPLEEVGRPMHTMKGAPLLTTRLNAEREGHVGVGAAVVRKARNVANQLLGERAVGATVATGRGICRLNAATPRLRERKLHQRHHTHRHDELRVHARPPSSPDRPPAEPGEPHKRLLQQRAAPDVEGHAEPELAHQPVDQLHARPRLAQHAPKRPHQKAPLRKRHAHPMQSRVNEDTLDLLTLDLVDQLPAVSLDASVAPSNLNICHPRGAGRLVRLVDAPNVVHDGPPERERRRDGLVDENAVVGRKPCSVRGLVRQGLRPARRGSQPHRRRTVSRPHPPACAPHRWVCKVGPPR